MKKCFHQRASYFANKKSVVISEFNAPRGFCNLEDFCVILATGSDGKSNDPVGSIENSLAKCLTNFEQLWGVKKNLQENE